MRFEHLDLNLLVALDVLLKEQNITRAAERLHLTQSATSGVLGRLRAYFEDDLLVQVGRKMQPTPYALELQQPVSDVLLTIRSSIITKRMFEPASSKRHFRIVTSDYLVTVLLTRLLQKVQSEAPLCTWQIMPPSESSADMLARGEIDMMIVPEQYLIEGRPSQLLFEEGHVCVIWDQNDQVGKKLTLEQYLDLGHVSVEFGHTRLTSIEEWFMAQHGVTRRLEVITQDFNSLPQLVVGTNRIATMHSRLASICARQWPIRILPPPVKLPTMREFMHWNPITNNDPMHRWLREKIVETVAEADCVKA